MLFVLQFPAWDYSRRYRDTHGITKNHRAHATIADGQSFSPFGGGLGIPKFEIVARSFGCNRTNENENSNGQSANGDHHAVMLWHFSELKTKKVVLADSISHQRTDRDACQFFAAIEELEFDEESRFENHATKFLHQRNGCRRSPTRGEKIIH